MFTRSLEISPVTLFRAKIVIQCVSESVSITYIQCLGAFHIRLRCFHMTQTSMGCTGSLFVPPAEVEQSRTELWSRAYQIRREPSKQEPNLTLKMI